MMNRLVSLTLVSVLVATAAAAVCGQEGATRPRRVGLAKEGGGAREAGPPRQLAGGVGASADEVGPDDVVRVDTTLVTVPVTVLDRQGRFVPGMRAEDFKVYEEGVEQRVAHFAPTEQPFTVALVLDTSVSTRFRLHEIRAAAVQFAAQLRPQDRVMVVAFSDDVWLLTEATSNRNVITGVINYNTRQGGGTRLYDAVDLVIKERLNAVEGRKAIVLFTDGVDTASYLSDYEGTVRGVEELDAMIFPIQYDTLGSVPDLATISAMPVGSRVSSDVFGLPSLPAAGTGGLPGTSREDYARGGEYLRALADKTGGRLYRADDTRQLADAFTQIAEELRRQYSLGYYPSEHDLAAGVRRRVKVRVGRPDLVVRARGDYVVGGARAGK